MTATDIRFTEHESGWSFYELEDGTIVRLRTVMIKVKCWKDEQDETRYDITPHLIVDIEPPGTENTKPPTHEASGKVQ